MTSRNISNSALRQGRASLWRYIWGWRVSVSPNVYVPLDRGNERTTTLLLEVFSQRKFVADFIQLKLSFIQKKEKFAFW